MFFLLPLVFARDPLFYSGSPTEAVRRVSDATGIAPWELDPQSLDSGVKQAVVVGAPATVCTSVVDTAANIRDGVSRAESKISYSEYAEAKQDLLAAASALRCLHEPAEASVASRLYLLLGVAHELLGEKDAANKAFSRALLFSPGLVFDSRLPPPARARFEAVASTKVPSSTLIISGSSPAPLWVDGRAAAPEQGRLTLPVGIHLVQLLSPGSHPVELNLSDEATLLLPGALSTEELREPSPVWDVLVSAHDPDGGRAFWVSDGGAWVGPGAWEALPRVSLQSRRQLATGLIASGATALLLGGGASAVSYGWASGVAAEVPSDNLDRKYKEGMFSNARAWAYGGLGAAAVGVGLLGAGVGLWVAPVPQMDLALLPSPDGATVVARITR